MTSNPDLSSVLQYKPVLRLHFNDATHPAIHSFVTLVDCTHLLPNAIKHVLNHLYTPYGREQIPPVRSVTIILRKMGGVAYTTGLDLDDMHKEIHVSLDYIARNCDQPFKFRDETIGVITHEVVHCFQHKCKGTAPGGLIEGIADYVRLKAGLAPPHWKKTREEIGKKWDEGYQRTAWFLEWLEDNRGAGTISRMNETMGRCEYKEDEFWPELFGKTVDTLWKRYVESWEEKETDTMAKSEAASPVGTEPEIVNLSPEEQEEAEQVLKKAQEFHA
jgi:Peptidase of plants and bacteria